MTSFAHWLTEIGLESYASVLAQNEVDFDVLASLTEADLQALGLPLGARKRLLQAVAKLDGQGAAEAVSPPTASLALAPSPTPEPPTGERRQLTVMFCDLVGSTALSEKLDPEELRSLLHNYRTVCGKVIARYEGFVARYVGDGILTYFGWPKAHEEDAERALRAALDIIQTVKSASVTEALSVRIGIATGPVVVGEQAGVGEQSKLAVGSTPNLAARLQGLAAADQIVIASSTRRLVGNAFELADLGEHDLKGIAEPVHAWQVQSALVAEGRFEATRGGAALTPFVGRDEELGLLFARWKQTRDGEGQIVLLSGEPGIGKSRITQILRERLADEAHIRLSYQCSPYHTHSAFYPIIAHLERAAGFERDDGVEAKLDKLEALLALEPDQLPTIAPLIAALLSLPIDRYPARMLSPQKQKELTMASLADQVIRLAQRHPVLMIMEDVHWIDPSTMDLLNLMPERVREASVLMLLTHRPEFSSRWAGQEHVTPLNLNRLPRRLGLTLVENVTGGKALPEEVLDQILAKTDGVPLFVEELTKNILESGFLTETPERYELKGPLPALAIPSSLQDSLMARLDRLASAKEIAQVGACIGREFSHELLAVVSPLAPTDLERDLQKLVDSGLVLRRGTPPQVTYNFKHALVQDAAYESLLKSRRQTIHEQIARALQAEFAEQIKAQPELLALHLTKAGLIDEATPQWLAAAQLAAMGTRYNEALSHVDAGRAIVARMAKVASTTLEVALLTTGAFCHFALAGYGSESAERMLVQAEERLDEVTDANVVPHALFAIGVHAWVRADFPKALLTYEKLGALADESSDIDRLVFAYPCLGSLLNNMAQFARSRRLLEFAIENYQLERHFQFVYAMGQDSKTLSCAWLGMLNSFAGNSDEARRYIKVGIAHTESIGHPFSLSLSLSIAGLALAELGQCDEAIRVCERCIELCEAQNLPFWMSWAVCCEGVALVRQGHYDRAQVKFDRVKQIHSATGSRNGRGFISAWQAIALAHQGRFDEARRETDFGAQFTRDSGELVWLPWSLHARGIAELLDPNAEASAAEQWFNAAIAEARSHDNRLMELRAANSLAGLWQSQGKRHEARELLAPIFGWFTEGFDTQDLKDAKALLDELQG